MEIFQVVSFLSTCALGLSLPVAPHSKNKLRDVDWWASSQQLLQENLQVGLQVRLAKNVIIFVGDGMGPSTVTSARILKAQEEEKSLHDTSLAWEEFPYTSMSKTYNVDQVTPDSAGTATAIFTGHKTNHGLVGLSQKTLRGSCLSAQGNELKSILKYSHEEGKWTGVVTTARITHATPASTYAAVPERGWEADSDIPVNETGCKDIARQLVEDNDFIKVLFGGGRRNFLPENETDPEYPEYDCRRTDGRNLMKEWEARQASKVGADKVKVVTNTKGFNTINTNKDEYVMGLFEPSHMAYELDRDKSPTGEPSITELVEKAIKLLKRSDKGFFLLVEGGRIDHGHHGNKARKALTETIAMSKAVTKATQLTDDSDTLIIVTADHSHVFTLGGYSHPDSDILGLSQSVISGTMDDLGLEVFGDDLPHLTLAYANGPGFSYHRTDGTSLESLVYRKNLTEDYLHGKMRDKNYRTDAAIYKSSETHGGEDVTVYARGPMSHLFRGTHEQTYIAHLAMYASCVGPNTKHCTDRRIYPGCEPVNRAGTLDIIVMKLMFVLFGCLLVFRRVVY